MSVYSVKKLCKTVFMSVALFATALYAPLSMAGFQMGETVMLKTSAGPYQGVILKERGDQYRILIQPTANTKAEKRWVNKSDLYAIYLFNVGDNVIVETQNGPYKAKIISVKNDQYEVFYKHSNTKAWVYRNFVHQ